MLKISPDLVKLLFCSMYMSYFDQDAMTKISETGWLISHRPRGWKSKSKCWQIQWRVRTRSLAIDDLLTDSYHHRKLLGGLISSSPAPPFTHLCPMNFLKYKSGHIFSRFQSSLSIPRLWAVEYSLHFCPDRVFLCLAPSDLSSSFSPAAP